MTIQVGDKVPSVNFKHMTAEGPADISSDEIFAGKKVVFFAVPGAFTPGCSIDASAWLRSQCRRAEG